MKRFLSTLALALALLPNVTRAQQQEPIDVGIMVDQIPAEFPSMFDRMMTEIRAVVGVGAPIRLTQGDVRPNGFDPARAEDIYRSMVDGDTDVIFAFGPVSASVVSGRDAYPKPTILFGGVNRDLLDLPEPGSTSGVSNFTYVITSESYERDLRTLKALYDFRTLGIVIPPGPIGVLRLEDRLDELMDQLGADLRVIGYESPASLASSLDGVDAVYLLESVFIPTAEVAEIAGLLIERRIPSFSGGRRDDVELGLMATNQPAGGMDAFMRRIALLMEAVVNGEDVADRPVFFDVTETLTVNFHTARAIGVPMRYSLITTTEFVGDYENPIAERTYSLLDLIDEALAANLSLESGRRDVRLAEQDARASWSNYLPSVSSSVTQSVLDEDLAAASGGRNPQYSAQGAVSFNQVVFSPDANAGISIQRELVGAQRDALAATEWDVILEAASAYFTTLIVKANVAIQHRNVEATRRNLRIAEQHFEAGQSGRGDVLRLRSESAQGMQSLLDAVSALDQAFHAINQVVNQPIGREIDVLDMTMEDGRFSDERFENVRVLLDDPSIREAFEDWLVLQAVENAPELRIFDRNIAAVGRSARLDGYERFLPTVAAGLDLNKTFDQWGAGAPDPALTVSQFYTLGVSASIPLFDSNQRRIRRQSSLIRQDQLQVDRTSTAVAIERAVRDVILDLRNEIANLELSAISEEAAAESLQLAQASYSSGAVNVVQLLDAQTNYLRAQLARASARYNFLATSVVAQRLVGHFFLLSSDAANQAFLERFEAFARSRAMGELP
jgi:outer membrane protein TolC